MPKVDHANYHHEVCPVCHDPWCHGCPTNEEFHAERDAEHKIERAAWAHYQSESIDPREQDEDEEFGTPNAAYCQSEEPDHNGGWFCHHPNCVTSPDGLEPESPAERFDRIERGQAIMLRREFGLEERDPDLERAALAKLLRNQEF